MDELDAEIGSVLKQLGELTVLLDELRKQRRKAALQQIRETKGTP